MLTNHLPSCLNGLHLIAAAALAELGETPSVAGSFCDVAARMVIDSGLNITNRTTNSQSTPKSFMLSTNLKVLPSKENKKFPVILHALLADPSVHDAISWLPHGRSFLVIRPEVLATRILPMYFASKGSIKAQKYQDGAMGKYPSFKRKLNRWGFRQVTHGVDKGAFYHKLFLRDDPEACHSMVCQKSMKSDSKSVSSASTASMSSSKKRFSSASVTLSKTGSLPFKKRRTIVSEDEYEMNIPSSVQMKTKVTKNTSSSCSSTVSTVSLEGYSCSSDSSKESKSVHYVRSDNTTLTTEGANVILTRNFHQEQRSHMLASLLENSRRAMLARDMEVETAASMGESLAAIVNDVVVAATVPIAESPVIAARSQQMAAAEAAKSDLFEAYKKAVLSL